MRHLLYPGWLVDRAWRLIAPSRVAAGLLCALCCGSSLCQNLAPADLQKLIQQERDFERHQHLSEYAARIVALPTKPIAQDDFPYAR